jgi:5-formyltetrahydrofolate cyclo-ligase
VSRSGQPYPAQAGLEAAEVKEALRTAIRGERDRLTARARARAGESFAAVVGNLPHIASARVVAAYAARPNEPQTTPLLEYLVSRGTRVMLPVLGTGLQRNWAWFTSAADLGVRAPGRPPEPSGPTLGADALSLVDAIIAPALAVDTDGGRLGQGGGWYDRVLVHAKPGVLVVAMVFADEVYDAGTRPLPRQPHDRPVDIAATPSGWQWVRTPPAPPAE